MCGRFALSIRTQDIEKLKPGFAIGESEPPRYNVAPSMPIAAAKNDGTFELSYLRWGLLPSWASSGRGIPPIINARVESLFSKPMYRQIVRRRRALVFATAYYEWKKIQGIKEKFPFAIMLPDCVPFTFAAIWDSCHTDAGARTESCAIITGPAAEHLEHIHPRMPVIIPEGYREMWLSDEPMPDDAIAEMLANPDAHLLEAIEVSRAVNSVANDSPECLLAADPFGRKPNGSDSMF